MENKCAFKIADIHEFIKTLPDNSIDFIYTNPPFATTAKKWDKPLRWDELWIEIDRVLKPHGVVALHSAIPFTYDLIAVRKPKYNYNWVKKNPTNFFLAKKQPLRKMEEILIYYKGQHTYNPQMEGDEVVKAWTRPVSKTNKNETYYGKQVATESKERVGRYPTTYLGEFKRVTQKTSPKSVPKEIEEKMIKTYSNENDLILDMTCCDRQLGELAVSLKRNYIGVDISNEFLKL